MQKNNIGVLFDLDGVLIDSESEYTKIWQRIESEYPTGVKDFATKIKGTNLEDILQRHYPDEATRGKVRERLYEEEGRMRYRYCRGAEAVLGRLKESGVPMALYTSSDHKKMEHLYRDIPEIAEYFDAIILGDMVEESKPSPEGYLKAAQCLGLEDGNWVVVEDSLQGVIAGKRSGGTVVGVAGTLDRDVLAPYSTKVIDSMEEFPFDILGLETGE